MKQHVWPLLIFVLVLCGGIGFSDETPISTKPDDLKWAGKPAMNDIAFKKYEDFEKAWKLVTVRYRQDNGEMRMIYANPVAYRTLQMGSIDYPRGAVFGKVAFELKSDPLFASSMVPSSSKRYQLMVRDKTKYKDTDGWGYALFDRSGKTFPGEVGSASVACAACHKIAASRGFVFAQFMNTKSTVTDLQKKSAINQAGVQFEDLPVTELPQALREHLPQGTTQVRSVIGEIKRHLFLGTLSEIKPTLIVEALKTGVPAVLFNGEKTDYVAAFTGPNPKNCHLGNASGKEVTVLNTESIDPKTLARPEVKSVVCH